MLPCSVRFCLVVGVVLAACAPSVDTPAEHQRAIDAADSARLSTQLAALPGAWSAHATLVRPIEDPLSPSQTKSKSKASAAVLVVIDDKADRAAIGDAVGKLVHGVAPEITAPDIVITQGEPRAELARVGPFSVERSSRRALIITLAIALAAIAALALGLASYARRGNSAQ
jgi:type III secretory pathway lipoprotein EscJ